MTLSTDILWIVVCTVLVFSMQAGFCCLQAGLSRQKCIGGGCTDYTTKPVNKVALLGMLTRYGRSDEAAGGGEGDE